MLTTLAKFTESTSSTFSQTVHQSMAGAGFGTSVTDHGDVQLFGHAVAHSVAHRSSHVSPSLSLSRPHSNSSSSSLSHLLSHAPFSTLFSFPSQSSQQRVEQQGACDHGLLPGLPALSASGHHTYVNSV